MRTKTLLSLIVLMSLRLLPFASCHAAEPQGTAFTYQGQLTDGGTPATGNYDLQFTLYDAVGAVSAVSGPITNSPVGVTNGLFTVTLDFGSGVFTGAARWLELGVRSNGVAASFNLLSPRQPLLAAPYALYAPGAGTAGTATTATTATSVGAGAVGAAGLQTGAVDSSKIADGSIGVSDLGPTVLLNTFWRLGGNAGTTPGTHFLGTTDNQPLELKVNGLRALRLEDNGDGAPNVIGGSPVNFVGAGIVAATIAGGGTTNYGGYGYTNAIWADFGVVGGGQGNRIGVGASVATIAGGIGNDIGSISTGSAIGGGADNNIAARSDAATIAGGMNNNIGTWSLLSAIGGGGSNNIAAYSDAATIAGGYLNDIGTNSHYGAIGGGWDNNILAYSGFATIAGGRNNDIGTNSPYSAIGGGLDNNISFYATNSTIGGGSGNRIASSSGSATIAGGDVNDIGFGARHSAIGGGNDNNIADFSEATTIGGGRRNDIGNNSGFSTVGGGYDNNIGASSEFAVLAGGYANAIAGYAGYAAIGGGNGNTIAAYGAYATIPGGTLNSATNYAFAAGLRAKANHTGAFVWGDSNNADIASTNGNSVTMRAAGGYRLFSNNGATVGVSVAAGGNAWSPMSDRNVKENFRSVDPRVILEKVAALPVTEWNLISQPADIRHLGPMAQDFKTAFGLGESDRHISTSDADGVALAAIQGLNEKLEAGMQSAEVRARRLEAENAELKQRLERLEALLLRSSRRTSTGTP